MTIVDILKSNVTLFTSDKEIIAENGTLTVFEQKNIFGSMINRVYLIGNVMFGTTRGFHAHRKLHQVLIVINGSITISVDDGNNKKDVTLDSQNKALLIGPNIWHTMTWNDNSASLLVLASEVYDEEDYIRDYEEFLSMVKNEDYSI
jgi:dTDP-4-dehydrorhamnose 3,5-epimerase-like enzyme